MCSLSGKPPTALCPDVKMEWAIDGVTQTFPCDMHTLKAGQRVVNLPASFRTEKPEEVHKGRANLSIISPVPGASYFAAPLDLERKIPMKTEGTEGQVWWYLDGEYIGTSRAEATFFHNVPDGEHLVSAVDEEGRSAKVTVKVFTPGRKSHSDLLF